MTATARRTKTNLDSVLRELADHGLAANLTDATYENIIGTGVRSKNLGLAIAAVQIVLDEKPITLRGLLYQIVSRGLLPSTDDEHYQRVRRLKKTLHKAGILPFGWVVDNVRSTIKPSSWSGLADFAETVRQAYRLDFWERLPDYVHVIVEKAARAATVQPVTDEFDVGLSPIRGYVSDHFIEEIAETWNKISKPITCYYLGDWDASGLDLERDARKRLSEWCNREFEWVRLALTPADFDAFNLIELAPKKKDPRYQRFVAQHGTRCAELDAIPADELRSRLRQAIERHIPAGEWERLQNIEEIERRQWNETMAVFNQGAA
jgi:hypothetical protein